MEKSTKKKICEGYRKNNCEQPVLAKFLCKNCIGNKFEDDVAELFELMGFVVEKDKHVIGRQVDLYFEYRLGISKIKGIVECKYHSKKRVGVEEISQLAATAGPLLRDRTIDRAYLITTRGFASTAKVNAQANGITCHTYDELLSSLIDFKPYLRKLVSQFEQDTLRHTFVNLNFERYREVKKRQNQYINQKEISVLEKPKVWVGIKRNISNYLNYWLDSSTSYHVSILGDFGAGKTSFSKHFAFHCAKKYLDDPTHNSRIPLLIRLGNFSRLEKGGVQAMITDFLVNECNLTVNYAAFTKFLNAGKLLLILDGFDEMSMLVDEKTRIRNFEFLHELSIGTNKVIITGRPGYFPDFSEIKELMGQTKAPDNIYEEVSQKFLSDENKKKPNYEILKLKSFSKKQINRFIQKQCKRILETEKLNIELNTLTQTISNTYNLTDLARRPVLLEIMVKTIPQIKEEIENLNIFILYQTYTNLWLKREWDKGDMRRLLTSEQRRSFMEELALEMYRENTSSIHYRDLQIRVKEVFPIETDSMLDYFEHDVRTCSFLNRTEEGHYKFIHKSIMEYFTATRLVNGIRAKDNRIFKSLLISVEVIDFIIMALNSQDKLTLIEWITTKENVTTFQIQNALNILIKLENNDLRGIDFRDSVFDNITFNNGVFTNCKFDRCSFKSCKFQRVRFVSCSFKKVSLNKLEFERYGYFLDSRISHFYTFISFINCDLSYVNISGKYFEDISFDNVKFYKSNIQESKFNRCLFKSCEFERANLNKTIFLKSTLTNSNFIKCYLRKVKFIPYSYRTNDYKDDSNFFNGVKFINSNLKESKFDFQLIKNVYFENCILLKASFIKCLFVNNHFKSIDLGGTLIVRCTFVKSDISPFLRQNTSLFESKF